MFVCIRNHIVNRTPKNKLNIVNRIRKRCIMNGTDNSNVKFLNQCRICNA